MRCPGGRARIPPRIGALARSHEAARLGIHFFSLLALWAPPPPLVRDRPTRSNSTVLYCAEARVAGAGGADGEGTRARDCHYSDNARRAWRSCNVHRTTTARCRRLRPAGAATIRLCVSPSDRRVLCIVGGNAMDVGARAHARASCCAGDARSRRRELVLRPARPKAAQGSQVLAAAVCGGPCPCHGTASKPQHRKRPHREPITPAPAARAPKRRLPQAAEGGRDRDGVLWGTIMRWCSGPFSLPSRGRGPSRVCGGRCARREIKHKGPRRGRSPAQVRQLSSRFLPPRAIDPPVLRARARIGR